MATDITQSHFFFYGNGIENGQQYGLYDLITNRIALTHNNLEVLKQVQMLLSSRYNFIILDLLTAVNWKPDLIDNSTCFQWGLDSEIRVGNPFETYIIGDPESVAILKLYEPLSGDELIVLDQEYFMLVSKVVEKMQEKYLKAERLSRKVEYKIEEELGIDLPVDLFGMVHNFDKINNVMYLGIDVEDVVNQINEINCELL